MRDFTSTRPAEGPEPEDHPLEGVQFTLDGKVFTCHPQRDASSFHLSILAQEARRGDASAEMAAMAESYLAILGQDEFDAFASHIEKHNTPDEVVGDILNWLHDEAERRVEEATARPTGEPSGSSRGPQEKAERTSRIISLGKGDVRVVPEPQDHKPRTRRRKTEPIDPAVAG